MGSLPYVSALPACRRDDCWVQEGAVHGKCTAVVHVRSRRSLQHVSHPLHTVCHGRFRVTSFTLDSLLTTLPLSSPHSQFFCASVTYINTFIVRSSRQSITLGHCHSELSGALFHPQSRSLSPAYFVLGRHQQGQYQRTSSARSVSLESLKLRTSLGPSPGRDHPNCFPGSVRI